MKIHDDIFGALLNDAFELGGAMQILERSDGYMAAVSVKGEYFSAFDEWPEAEQNAMEYVSGRVLDIGCGAGKHSLYLQKEGFKVTGIDISKGAVEVARQRGLEDARQMPFEAVTELGPGFADTVLMLGNNFGLMQNRAKCAEMLAGLAKITAPKARLIAQSLDVTKTCVPEHLEYQRANLEAGRMLGQISLRHRYKNYTENWWDYLFVTPEEMRELLNGSGWEMEEILNDGPQYIAILRKSALTK